ncbi:hypothetical protein [Nocardia sp. NPDC051463]
MQTLIVVVVVVAVLALATVVVQFASRLPEDEGRWYSDDYEENWDDDEDD